VRCPRCGAENPAALSTCEVCGSPLRRVTVVDDGAPPVRSPLWQSPPVPPTAPHVPATESQAAPPVSPAVGQAWGATAQAAGAPNPSALPRGALASSSAVPLPRPGAAMPAHRTVLAGVERDDREVKQVRGVLLEYRSRSDVGKVHTLFAGRTAIGRSADCDIVLDDMEASKQHAIIYIRGDDASFMDISSNGSAVDGRRVHGGQATLQQGSMIVIGTRLYVFLFVSERALAGMK